MLLNHFDGEAGTRKGLESQALGTSALVCESSDFVDHDLPFTLRFAPLQ